MVMSGGWLGNANPEPKKEVRVKSGWLGGQEHYNNNE